MIQNKEGILATLAGNQVKIKSFGIKRLGLFGSYAKGKQTIQSDIDLLVEFEEGKKTFDNFIQLSFLLEDLLGKKIELVTPESLSPYIKPNIAKEVEYVIPRACPYT
ncbi:MAG: nucleotidyltransferase family protein [Candidatus Omnitrophota bacterium]